MSDIRRVHSLSAAVAAVLISAAAVGCESAAPNPNGGAQSPATSPTTSPARASPTASPTGGTDPTEDYSRLLLQASDLSSDEDTFTVASTNPGPDGLPGASALFVNRDDTRAISDTIVIYPDAETATTTLRNALPRIDMVVAGATPQPVPVGTDGTIAVGTSPDATKAVTLLLFTHGPALVRLEFHSALGDTTTNQFVINIGKMQEIALRTGRQ